MARSKTGYLLKGAAADLIVTGIVGYILLMIFNPANRPGNPSGGQSGPFPGSGGYPYVY